MRLKKRRKEKTKDVEEKGEEIANLGHKKKEEIEGMNTLSKMKMKGVEIK